MLSQSISSSFEMYALDHLKRLAAQPPYRGCIPFPVVFSRICPALCMKKAEIWQLLWRLRDDGRISIVPFHGIRIKGDAN